MYRNPLTAVDIVIEVYKNNNLEGIVLIKRGHEPFKDCWALPGGFQEYGESLEKAAVREAKEETDLDVTLLKQLCVYSNPDRDPRAHVNSIGYVASANGTPLGGDDASDAKIFPLYALPKSFAFDHKKRIEEYLLWRKNHGNN